MRVGMLVDMAQAVKRMEKVFGDEKGPVQKILASNAKIMASETINVNKQGWQKEKAAREAKLDPAAAQVQELYDAYTILSRVSYDLTSRDVSIR